MTKKYRIITEQIIEAEVDEKNRKSDIKLIKEEIKSDPPFVEILGTGIRYKTTGKIKFKKIIKTGEYKTCPKCKGKGEITKWRKIWGVEELETTECYRCNGRGEILKRNKKK